MYTLNTPHIRAYGRTREHNDIHFSTQRIGSSDRVVPGARVHAEKEREKVI